MARLRRSSTAVALALGLLVATLGGSALVADEAAAADPPVLGEWRWDWYARRCVAGGPTGFRLVADGQAKVLSVRSRANTYYMKIEVHIQKRVLGGWRAIATSKTDSSRFTWRGLPYYSRRAVATPIGATLANGGTFRGRVVVRLMRVRTGPDPTVWRAETFAPIASCSLEPPTA